MAATQPKNAAAILSSILTVLEQDIIPLGRKNATAGAKVFGAAILASDTLAPAAVAINDERDWPLLHGETNCIREFFQNATAEARPNPRNCIFFATHEPCALCLSGIAWSSFPVVYHLFTYEDTRDLLGISGDIDILEEVFRVPAAGETEEDLKARPLYNKSNKFFVVHKLAELLDGVEDVEEKTRLQQELNRVRDLYIEISKPYRPSAAEPSGLYRETCL